MVKNTLQELSRHIIICASGASTLAHRVGSKVRIWARCCHSCGQSSSYEQQSRSDSGRTAWLDGRCSFWIYTSTLSRQVNLSMDSQSSEERCRPQNIFGLREKLLANLSRISHSTSDRGPQHSHTRECIIAGYADQWYTLVLATIRKQCKISGMQSLYTIIIQ